MAGCSDLGFVEAMGRDLNEKWDPKFGLHAY